jgi:hypothetical protein
MFRIQIIRIRNVWTFQPMLWIQSGLDPDFFFSSKSLHFFDNCNLFNKKFVTKTYVWTQIQIHVKAWIRIRTAYGIVPFQ